MSSQSHSAEGIIGPCIAHVTSARGGGRPALTRSRSPTGSGKRRAEWDDGRLNDRHYLGHMVLPRSLTQRTRRAMVSASFSVLSVEQNENIPEVNLLEAKFVQLNPARRTMNRKGATALEAKKISLVTTPTRCDDRQSIFIFFG
jgi:hypothetical protein